MRICFDLTTLVNQCPSISSNWRHAFNKTVDSIPSLCHVNASSLSEPVEVHRIPAPHGPVYPITLVLWPPSAMHECGIWLREVLK